MLMKLFALPTSLPSSPLFSFPLRSGARSGRNHFLALLFPPFYPRRGVRSRLDIALASSLPSLLGESYTIELARQSERTNERGAFLYSIKDGGRRRSNEEQRRECNGGLGNELNQPSERMSPLHLQKLSYDDGLGCPPAHGRIYDWRSGVIRIGLPV